MCYTEIVNSPVSTDQDIFPYFVPDYFLRVSVSSW